MTDTWTWATVTAVSPLRIKVDGDTTALDATTDNLVGSLAVFDRVRVHLHSDGIIVTGIQGGNDKVYMISHPESDPPGAYPAGITVSDTGAGGWPAQYATVVTNAVNINRTSQVVYEKDGPERQWWRTGRGTTWTAWKETAAYESDGRLKAADGVAADDVATVGQMSGTFITPAQAAEYLVTQTVWDSFGTAATPVTVTDSGDPYRAEEGAINASGGHAVASADVASAVTVDAGSAYATVSLDLYVGSSTADHGVRLCVGDTGTTYLAIFAQPGASGKLAKIVGGAYTQLGTLTKPGSPNGTFDMTIGTTMRLDVSLTFDGHVLVKRDGETYLDYTLTPTDLATFVNNHRHGFYLKKASWYVDNFMVRPSLAAEAQVDPTVLSKELGAIVAYSEENQIANGLAHLIENGGDIENTLALKNSSTGSETYTALTLVDQLGAAKSTYGFGNISSVLWSRRAYLETWEGQTGATTGEVPDFILVQTRSTPSRKTFVRFRAIGGQDSDPGDFVIYKNVPWTTSSEPADSRALTIDPTDGSILVETPGMGIKARSADGTIYSLIPPNGGGAATWV